MSINYLLIILISFLAGISLVGLFRKLALKYRLLLTPQGTPLIGGVSIGLSFILICLFTFFRSLPKEVMGLLFASLIILIFGIIDDWRESSILAKFFVQIIATWLLIFFGIRTQIVYIGNLINIIITFMWVLGITNAFNHLDVMDGLAGGLAIIVSSAFFAISILNGDIRTAILSLTLAGVAFSFFLYNFPPAKIYMGNAGSHFLGFTLAAIALIISYAPLERKIALLSPILILGFPIFDTAFLILMRLTRKRSVFKKSNDHLALRFLKSGHSKNRTLLSMLLLGLFFSLCGVIVSQVSNPLGIIIIIFVALVSLVITFRMGKITIND